MEHLSVRICQARAHREREQQLPVAIVIVVRDVNVLFMGFAVQPISFDNFGLL